MNFKNKKKYYFNVLKKNLLKKNLYSLIIRHVFVSYYLRTGD